jgi:hypothetical protein
MFMNRDTGHEVDADLPGGALSPDGRWYASPYGIRVMDEQTYNVITTLNEIRVHSTFSEEEYRVAFPIAQFFQQDFGQIHWRDNEHFVYPSIIDGTLLVNPFTDEAIPMKILDPIFGPWGGTANSRFSPDWTRVLNTADYRFAEDFTTGPENSDIVEWNIYDITSEENPLSLAKINASFVSWMPDSSHFVAEIPNTGGDEPQFRVALFDKNGELSGIVFDLPHGERLDRSINYNIKEMAWSPDNQFLAFSTFDESRPPISNLYFADVQQRKVIDTCLATGTGFAWSPSGTQVALLVNDSGESAIGILDMTVNQVYVVGYNVGGVIGWRTND